MGKFDPKSKEQDGASPGKIFIGGLAKNTTMATFTDHFGKYGEIIDSVIMKDRHTNQPRGFGFVTYADPSVVDKVIKDTHVINGKQVEIKRTIPRGAAAPSNDFKTKKIFVGGIPSTVSEDALKDFFSKYGKVVDHEIIRDHSTNRSRGFGFVVFDSEKVVDDLISKGNMIDLAGSQVEIKKAEPKKGSNPLPSSFSGEMRDPNYGDTLGRFGNTYSAFRGEGFGPGPYRTPGLSGSRLGAYEGGPDEFSGRYGLGGGLGGYRGESSLGYPSRLGPYGGEFGRGYGSGIGLGGYAREERFGALGGGYDGSASYLSGYGYDGAYGSEGFLGNRGGYGGGAGRYHPYGR